MFILGLLSKLHKLAQLSLTQFVYYNFLSRKVERRGRGLLLPFRGSCIDIGRGSRIVLENGHFFVNSNKPSGARAEAYVKLRENATLIIHDTSTLNYKATIELHDGATVEIGSAYINSDAVVLAARRITIGRGVLISRMVFIFDADHHPIRNEAGEVINSPRPVEIADHVWIGLKSLILRGSKIGPGAVIAAGSLVGGRVKSGTMAASLEPARSYSKIIWGDEV